MIPQRRKQTYIQAHAELASGKPFTELARMTAGKSAQADQIFDWLDEYLMGRKDTADFELAAVIRILYGFRNSSLLDPMIVERLERSIFSFRYWPDEPGQDDMCFWSENHYILFSTAGYLLGCLYSSATFANSSLSGKQLAEKMLPKIRLWLKMRFATGFSEWLSNVYYNEDIPALVNLVDFAPDPELSTQAAMVLDLLLADVALNSFRGSLACTHGRSYENAKKYPRSESMASTCWLLWETGTYTTGNFAAISLAASLRYEVPEVIQVMGQCDLENFQTHGWLFSQADWFGFPAEPEERALLFLTNDGYAHPETIHAVLRLLDNYHLWDNIFLKPLKQHRTLLKLLHPRVQAFILWLARKDISRTVRDIAHTLTYRTEAYQLSTALDYRPGYGGDQHAIFQGTLGGNATVFTTHPAKLRSSRENDTPNYWTGYGTLPQAAQYKNVAIELYRLYTGSGLYVSRCPNITHMWFPKAEFDAVFEQGFWHFACKGNGLYAGYASGTPSLAREENEKVFTGSRQVFIHEFGSLADYGTFENFIRKIFTADLQVNGLKVKYHSPSRGLIDFDYSGAFRVDGQAIDLTSDYRYQNPFCRADFPSKEINFEKDGYYLFLDWAKNSRIYGRMDEP